MALYSSATNSPTKTISITSGKGGVGKTTLIANLAIELKKRGQRVLIFDGDLGMANVDIMFGVRSNGHILDVVNGKKSITDILTEIEPQVHLIPGGSGVADYNTLSAFQRRALLDSLSSLEMHYDYLLIDTAPGIADNVLYLNNSAQAAAVIITPEPASFADSYALIKVLNQRFRDDRFAIICNQVRDEREGHHLFQKFHEVVSRFLYVSLEYWGSVQSDDKLRAATHQQRLILKHDPQAISSVGIAGLCDQMMATPSFDRTKGGLQVFWESLVGVA